MDVQYDPAEGRLAYWDIGLRAKMDKITYYIGYLRRDHDMYDFYWTDTIKDALIYGGFIHHVCDTFDWSLYLRHNIERSELEEIGGFVQYNLDCISFRLNLEYLMDYVSEDGYKHDSDFRISLGAWLRIFPKEDDHDWMEWGNLTNMRLLGEIKE
jgi:meiotically up-regulated gene 157 (Mug157) protein